MKSKSINEYIAYGLEKIKQIIVSHLISSIEAKQGRLPEAHREIFNSLIHTSIENFLGMFRALILQCLKKKTTNVNFRFMFESVCGRNVALSACKARTRDYVIEKVS